GDVLLSRGRCGDPQTHATFPRFRYEKTRYKSGFFQIQSLAMSYSHVGGAAIRKHTLLFQDSDMKKPAIEAVFFKFKAWRCPTLTWAVR
ncbi:hypothetical protein, partial [Vibrio breoganii]|uniref:hypothetical protein n=1 Tax=Vibrio breoganii TaxID=553239 RepID=UPI001A7E0A34